MVRCRTELDKNAMMALTKYHVAHSTTMKRRKNLLNFLGIISIILCIYSAYDSWTSYYGTESIFVILAMPFIFALLSVAVFFTASKGMQHGLYRELEKYFKKTNIKCLDYVISENGIRISINGNATTYKWDMIDNFEEDDAYYYFSSEGKYNIIAKGNISSKNQEILDGLIKK